MNKILVTSTIFAIGYLSFVFFSFQADSNKVVEDINVIGQPTIGSKTAPIQIVVFQDLKCVNCKYFNEHIYPKIKKNFIDTGQAKYTLVPLAFLRGSKKLATAAFCVYQYFPDRFFPFIEEMTKGFMRNSEWDSLESLLNYAKRARIINRGNLARCMKYNDYSFVLRRNFELAESVMGKKVGTPAIFINGKNVSVFSYPSIEKAVKREIHLNEE